jgi:RNase P/RNase MRP subunit p30
MKTNLVLLKETKELLELSTSLGFEKTKFLEKDFMLINLKSKKEALKQIQKAKQKGLYSIAKPKKEDMLRFLLEKTPIDMVFGLELIHPKEHYHYRRGGIDHVLAKIASDTKKTIGFSFSDILNTKEKSRILGRMMHNFKMCRKFKVQVMFSTFATSMYDLRSTHDLASLQDILGGIGLPKSTLFEAKKE